MVRLSPRKLSLALLAITVLLASPGTAEAQCTVACPANITVSNDPNQCGGVVNYPAPTITGSCGTITCSPPSGSFFPVGLDVDCRP